MLYTKRFLVWYTLFLYEFCMKKLVSAMNVTRFLFLMIALAAVLSMAINTGSFEKFLRFFSISSNMIIAFCMIYLFIHLPDFKDANKKKLVIHMLLWVFLYLLLWNGLPLLLWMYQEWLAQVLSQTGVTPLRFMTESLLQIVIIPLILYVMLRYETKNVFKERTGLQHHILQALIVCGTLAGITYLVIAAMS